ncbi:hypothetical protein GF312_12520 [Candidatus Poribacteria bacterium]|nr:hypothetical protein [Candidatus Poribacteria bacterium]
MFKKILISSIIAIMFITVIVQRIYAISLEEAMMRLQIETLKAQMDKLIAEGKLTKAKVLLGEMVELDERISYMDEKNRITQTRAVQQETEYIYQKPEKPESEIYNKSESSIERYERVISETCRRMNFEPAVIWTLLAIESNFSEDPVVIQRRTKCLGPWQHQPEHYKHYRKADGSPYNPFDINDACEVTVKIMKDNIRSTGSLEKSIRMYASGTRYLDRPYDQLPGSLKQYLNKFKRLYPEAKTRFYRESN